MTKTPRAEEAADKRGPSPPPTGRRGRRKTRVRPGRLGRSRRDEAPEGAIGIAVAGLPTAVPRRRRTVAALAGYPLRGGWGESPGTRIKGNGLRALTYPGTVHAYRGSGSGCQDRTDS